MSTLLAYLVSRLLEPTTRAGVLTVLTAAALAYTHGADSSTLALTVLAGLGGILCPEAKPVLDAVDIAVQKARNIPPIVGSMALMVMLGSLSACSTGEVQAFSVACAVDGVAQHVAVALAPLVGAEGVAVAAADVTLIHPAVVAACRAVGGKPVSVVPAG